MAKTILSDNSSAVQSPEEPDQFEKRTLAALDRAYESAILRELEHEARPEVAE